MTRALLIQLDEPYVGRLRSRDGDEVACLDFSGENAIESSESLSEQLRVFEPVEAAVLLPASHLWVSVAVRTPGQHGVDGKAAGYTIEPCLPWPIEDVVWGCVPSDGVLFAACMLTEHAEWVVETLRRSGVSVAACVPHGLAAAQAFAADAGVESGFVRVAGRRTELVQVHRRRPVCWRSSDPSSADDVLSLMMGNAALLGDASKAHVYSLPAEDDGARGRTIDEALLAFSERVASGRQTPWIDVCSGFRSLDRASPLGMSEQLLAGSLACLILSLMALFFIRASQYQAIRQELQRDTAALYRQAMPESRSVPQGVRSRLRSELAMLRATQASDADDIDALRIADSTLFQLLEAIPESLRINIDQIRVNGASVAIDGEARSHGDVGRLIDALRENGIEAAAPRAELSDSGVVRFQFTARVAQPTIGAS